MFWCLDAILTSITCVQIVTDSGSSIFYISVTINNFLNSKKSKFNEIQHSKGRYSFNFQVHTQFIIISYLIFLY